MLILTSIIYAKPILGIILSSILKYSYTFYSEYNRYLPIEHCSFYLYRKIQQKTCFFFSNFFTIKNLPR